MSQVRVPRVPLLEPGRPRPPSRRCPPHRRWLQIIIFPWRTMEKLCVRGLTESDHQSAPKQSEHPTPSPCGGRFPSLFTLATNTI